MDLRAKDPCHCGSGRRYKHCHMEENVKRRRTIQLISIFVPIVVIGIGLVLWSQRNDNASLQQLLTGQPGGSQSSSASADQSPLPEGRTPVAWEYDAEKDRYWDPGHTHWHDGQPPPEDLRTTATANTPASNLQNTNPNIPNPEPYQYDPLTNQHYDPGHGHWHNGQQPPPEQRSASTPSTSTSPITSTTVQTPSANQNPNIPNPEPWQFNAESNQHYHPGHGHWHNGQPPPEDQRNATQPTTSTSIQSTGNSNPNIANPVPYQYDPNTNQYYDPNHAHWHSGQPPPPDQRQ